MKQSLHTRLLESAFLQRVTKKLRTLKRTWFYKSADRARRGIPDILMCVNGHFVGLELKRDNKARLTGLQAHTLNKISQAGGRAIKLTPENWDEVWEMLQMLAGDLPVGSSPRLK